MPRRNRQLVLGFALIVLVVGGIVYLVQAQSYRRALQHVREHPGVHQH